MSLPNPFRVAVISDIHYAGPAETARGHSALERIRNPLRRALIRQHRHWVWLREPWAHNALLDRFIREHANAHLVVANGDYACDTACVGVSDDAAFESAALCLGKLRSAFGQRFFATFGDHEIGKKMFGEDEGGLRLASFDRAEKELALQPLWQTNVGRYALIGITSTLIALPIFEPESLAGEIPDWRRLREHQLGEIRRVFTSLAPDQRVLLFCHDPTALPFLWREEAVRARLPQIERTIIGHLHTDRVFHLGRLLAGLPRISFLGHTPKRLSTALREARHWRPFKPLLCPSPTGLQLFKDGGCLTVELDPHGGWPARFQFHPFGW